MEARQNKLTTLLERPDIQFIIPVYQRSYDWSEKQCQKLLDDIKYIGSSAKEVSHFIGSIVYIHDGIFTSNANNLTIIDGQQRLTTVILVWLALYRKAKASESHSRLANEIEKKFLLNEFRDNDEKIKLKPVQQDNIALKSLLEETESEFDGHSRIIANFHFFNEKISTEEIELVKAGIHKLTFVEISLDRNVDDPQKIFESLNSTGLDLSQGDLIRNYVLMRLEPSLQEKLYNQYWQKIEIYTREEDTLKKRLSDFIRDYLTLMFQQIPNEREVFETFKKRYVFTDTSSREESLKQISKYAKIYDKLINPQHETDREIRKQITFINQLEVRITYPFLLGVYGDYEDKKIDKATFIQVLELIQSYICRRLICDLPSSSLNKIFSGLYHKVTPAAYLLSLQKELLKRRGKERFPDDSELTEKLAVKDLYTSRSKFLKYILIRLEGFNNNESVDLDPLTIEHILPQNPDKSWYESLPPAVVEDLQKRYLHTLANLTLSGNNGSLGNKGFIAKRDMNVDQKEQGYIYSRLFLNRYLRDLNQWTEHEITERFKILADRFVQVWKQPNVQTTSGNEEINFCELEDFKHQKIEYAIFGSEKIADVSFKKLFEYVVNALYELDAELFFSQTVKNIIHIRTDPNSFRSPFPIKQSGYFSFSHGSATDLGKAIKSLLQVYDLEDELLIKFKEEEVLA